MLNAIKKFTDGESVGASRLNELVEKINLLARLVGEGGGGALLTPGVVLVAFKVVESLAEARGYYKLKTFEGEFAARPDDGDLTEEQLGELSEGVDAIGVNLLQVGGAGSDVEADAIYLGMLAGRIDDDSAYADLPIVAFAPGGGGESIGQYQDMYHKMVSDLQGGWALASLGTMEP
jgi:hypothetical protein